MAKKCIPGLFCIENMTLFMLFVIFLLLVYLYLMTLRIGGKLSGSNVQSMYSSALGGSDYTAPDVFNNERVPPLNMEDARIRTLMPSASSSDPRTPPMNGIPINVNTRSAVVDYNQLGLLTRSGGGEHNDKIILPLFGRQSDTGRSKYQYYTMSNTGSVSTKLPVNLAGKSCTSERGCDEIVSGDMVYVEGYGDVFKATVYENGLFRYLPF
jgi:hypothetical protein